MGWFNDYRQRRLGHTGVDTVNTLSAMEWYFGQGGRNWTRGEYHGADGTKCLVGAAQALKQGAIEDARYWIRQAIAERGGLIGAIGSIELFNDTRVSFSDIAEVLARAKQLAMAHAGTPRPHASPALPEVKRPALTHQPQEAMPVVKITMADLERVAVPPKK